MLTKRDKLFIYSSFVLNILLILVVYANASAGNYLSNFYNADHLFSVSLYNELFTNGSNIKGWSFPGAPGIFPDLTLHFILHTFIKNTGWIHICYSIIQLILLLLFFDLLIFQLWPTIKGRVLALSNLFLGLIYMVSLTSGNIHSTTFHLMAVNYHTGAILASLICMFLTVNYIKKRSRFILILLLFVCFLSVLSDRLVILFYLLPFSFAYIYYFIMNRNPVKHLLFLGLICGAAVLAIITFQILENSLLNFGLPHYKLTIKHIAQAFIGFKNVINEFFTRQKTMPIVLFISLLSYISCLILFIRSIITRKNNTLKDNLSDVLYFESIYLFYLVLIPIALTAPIITGVFKIYIDIRFFEIVFYLGLMMFPVFLNQIVITKKINKALNTLLYLFIIVLFGSSLLKNKPSQIKQGLVAYVNYYPDYIEFLDSVKDKYHLKEGLTDYWHTNPINILSKNNIRVHSMNSQLLPTGHLANYNRSFEYDGNNPAVYNFYYVNNNFNSNLIFDTYADSVLELKFKNMQLFIVPPFTINKSNLLIEMLEY